MDNLMVFCWPLQTRVLYAEPYLSGCAYVRDDQGAHVVDFEQQRVTPARFQPGEWIPFCSGRGWVKRNQTWILLDDTGREIRSMDDSVYMPARPFSQGYSPIWDRKRRLFGFVDQQGHIVAGPQFGRVGSFRGGYVSVRRKDGRYGIMNGQGDIVYESDADYLSDVWDGKCLETWGRYANSCRVRVTDVMQPEHAASCEKCIPGTFKGEWDWHGGYLIPYYGRRWARDNRFGLLALSANLDSGKKWDSAAHERQGYSRVYARGRFFFVDRTLTPLGGDRHWQDASDFSEDKAAVQHKNGKWGYIDLRGKTVIEPQFDWADRYFSGFAIVRMDGRYGFINEAGDLCGQMYDRLLWIDSRHRYIIAEKENQQYIIAHQMQEAA